MFRHHMEVKVLEKAKLQTFFISEIHDNVRISFYCSPSYFAGLYFVASTFEESPEE